MEKKPIGAFLHARFRESVNDPYRSLITAKEKERNMMKATNTSWRWLQSVTIATQRLSTRSFSSRVRVRDLPTPSFVINRHVFQRNCQTVLDAAESHNLKLRPHVKTHKTIPGAILQATGQITGTANDFAELIGKFDLSLAGVAGPRLTPLPFTFQYCSCGLSQNRSL